MTDLRAYLIAATCLLAGAPAWTQDADAPLSAIGWLSDSLEARPEVPDPQTTPPADLATNALPEAVTVSRIETRRPDGVGLVPATASGLPRDLWARSAPDDIARRILALTGRDLTPAARRLFNTLLLAELDPPRSDLGHDRLFLARIDALLAEGQVEQSEALLARAGVSWPDAFRRWFDAQLLMGSEAEACATLTRTPGLSPTFPTRIFCLARSGDWPAAAVTLETAEALDFVSEEEDALLARFLDPELFEGEPALVQPSQPSPLVFRLMEAIGEPMGTATLPLAFARSDLRPQAGWKARAYAAERLARAGALSANQWIGIWTEQSPAASGGIWDRIEALQRFDTAFRAGDPGGMSATLPAAWSAVQDAGLEVVFAEVYGPRLARLPLDTRAAPIAVTVGLLSPAFEHVARANQSTLDPLIFAVATGATIAPADLPQRQAAIARGFAAEAIPARLSGLIDEGRLGEAILRALSLLEGGAAGDLDELTDAIAFLRRAGLEDTARRASLEIMLLERRV